MEEIKTELERAKMKNYILQKENDILLGTIGIMAKEKEELIKELANTKKTFAYRAIRKIRGYIKKA